MRRLKTTMLPNMRHFLAALVVILGLQSNVQATSVTSDLLPGYHFGCPEPPEVPITQCCLKFTITVTHAPETVNIDLLSDIAGANINCFDWDCYTGANHYQGAFPHNKGVSESFGANGTYVRYLCPNIGDEACAMKFSAFQWIADGLTINENGEGGLSWNCDGEQHNCSLTCDIIRVYNNGTNIVFCVTRNFSSGTDTLKVHFSQPLQYPCNFNGGNGSFGFQPPPYINYPSDWRDNAPTNPKTDFIFVRYAGGQLIGPCQTACFSIPICGDGDGYTPTNRDITITTDGTDSCSNQTVNRTFKIMSDGAYLADGTRAPDLEESLPNYPNPLTSANEFKTMIPFTSKIDGEATILVMNEAGQKVLTEAMEVTKGKHFFYFTGEMLPAGRYFYTIQSPRGREIVKRSLLIVK